MRKVKNQHSIANKFALAVFLFSFICAAGFSCVILIVKFNHDIQEIHAQVEHLHLSVEPSLSTALWLTNDDVVEAVLSGMKGLPLVEEVTLVRDDGSVVSYGASTSSRTIIHSHPIIRQYRGNSIELGTIRMTVGLDAVYNKFYSIGWKTFLGIIALSLLGAWFTFFLFYWLAGRHLSVIAEKCRGVSLEALDIEFSLARITDPQKPDELDMIVSSLMFMEKSLRTSLTNLQEKEREFERIVTSVNDGILRFDRQSRLVYVNPAACRVLGKTEAQVVGSTLVAVGVKASTAAEVERRIRMVFERGDAQDYSFSYVFGNGEYRSYEVLFTPEKGDGHNVQSVVGILRDVTSRVKSESIIRTAFNRMPMLMSISDVDTGCYREVNDTFCRVTGFSREETVGKSSIELGIISKEVRKILFENINDIGFISGVEVDIILADSTSLPCKYFGEIIEITGERKLLSFVQDISGEKKAEKEQFELQRQLNQASKMEAIGTLAGGIAHDFNNILGAILGYGQFLQEELPPDSPLQEHTNQIMLAGNRAADLVKQILAFSKQGDDEVEPVMVGEIIEEVVKLLRSTLPTTIELSVDVEQGCGLILANPVQIHQVVMNICTNARQALKGDRGEICISLGEATVGQGVFSADGNTLAPGKYIRLVIRDSGVGMSLKMQTKIFDPFFTTKGKHYGTGLGLASTLGIVNKYKGGITCESVLGKGTTFSVYLPVLKAHNMQKKRASEKIALCGSEHVLLVDDDTILLDMLSMALTRLGYQVSAFSESPEAMDFFRHNHEVVDLVVSDMTMPHMTGFQLADNMFAIRPDLKFILCTGYSEMVDEKTARQLGIAAYLNKPVPGKALAREVRRILDRKRQDAAL